MATAALTVWSATVEARERAINPQAIQQRQTTQAQAVAQAAIAAQQQAQINRSQTNLSRATDAVIARMRSQSVSAAQALSIPNGLAVGGLEPYPGVNPDPVLQDAGLKDQGLVWQGANLPTQTVDPGATAAVTDDAYDVTVVQTEPKAIFTWKSFNISEQTTLNFQQRSADGAIQPDWVALNRVVAATPDPVTGARAKGASASLIYGRINADANIIVIDPNGIMVGLTGSINTRTLIASALDIGQSNMRLIERNAYFLNPPAGKTSFSFQFLVDEDGVGQGTAATKYTSQRSTAGFSFDADEVEGDITIAAGAEIQTEALSDIGPLGRIALIAPNVTVGGTLKAPDGQVVIAGTRNATLYANDGTNGLSIDPVVRGVLLRSGPDDADSVIFPELPTIPGASKVTNTRSSNYGRQSLKFFGVDFVFSADVQEDSPLAYAGSVVNTGVISTPRGNTTIEANAIDQSGLIYATTAVNAPGSIYLLSQDAPYVTYEDHPVITQAVNAVYNAHPGQITFGPNSVVTILPDTQLQADGTPQTITVGSLDTYQQSVIDIAIVNGFNTDFFDINDVPDRAPVKGADPYFQDIYSSSRGRVLGTIEAQSGSLLVAPGADLTIRTMRSTSTDTSANTDLGLLTGLLTSPPEDDALTPGIIVRNDATIDVSGLMDVSLAMESNLISIQRVGGNQLADMPLQQDGFIFAQRDIIIDRREKGVRDDGTEWVGTPLFDATADVDNATVTVDQLMTSGGLITLAGVSVVEDGANISIAGGYTHYRDGYIDTTKVITADGRVLDIADADPNLAYSGLAVQTVTHQKWGRTETFDAGAVDGVGSGSTFEAGYLEGADAGTLRVLGFSAFDAVVDAGVVQGAYQREGSRFASTPPKAGTLDFSNSYVFNLTFQSSAAAVADPVAVGEAVSFARFTDRVWSTERLMATGAALLSFGNPATFTNSSLTQPILPTKSAVFTADAALTLPSGGSFSLAAQDIDIKGKIAAASGDISFLLTSEGPDQLIPDHSTFTLDAGAVLDVAGLWVQDWQASRDSLIGSDYINGGSISISTSAIPDRAQTFPDTSTIDLRVGSLLNLSSGGYVNTKGDLARDETGVPLGRGGDLSIVFHPDNRTSLIAGNRPSAIPIDDDSLPTNERREIIDDALTLDSTIVAYGFQGGGRFTLQGPNIIIADDSAIGSSVGGVGGQFYVPASFFTRGFGAYDLTGVLTSRIEPGTRVVLTQPQYQPHINFLNLSSVAEAADIGFSIGVQRRPVDFSLAGLGWVDYRNVGYPSAGYPSKGNQVLGDSLTAKSALSIGEGSAILADPGASIDIGTVGQLTIAGTIQAHGGSIEIIQASGISYAESDTDQTRPDITIADTSLFITSSALFDVSGTYLADPLVTLWRGGEVLDGGTVSLVTGTKLGTKDQPGNLIAQPGGRIDVSGTSATLDLLQTGNGGRVIQANFGRKATQVSGNAGSINVTMSGILSYVESAVSLTTNARTQNGLGLFESTLIAHSGGGTSANGQLSLIAAGILFTQGAESVADDLEPGEIPTDRPGQQLIFDVDGLADSDIDILNVANFYTKSGVVSFAGDVALRVPQRIVFNNVQNISVIPSGSLSLLPKSTTTVSDTTATTGGQATIRSDYVAFLGGNNDSTAAPVNFTYGGAPTSRLGTLAVEAGTLDFGGIIAFDNLETARFASVGDIRFVPNPAVAVDGVVFNAVSWVRTNSDIEFEAAQLYPATGVSAFVSSGLADGTITIRGNGNPSTTPYSAGGALTFSAAHIVQDGTVRAPLGTLTFGVNDRADFVFPGQSDFTLSSLVPFQPTKTVRFEAGSLSSVSADDLLIPYGQTENQRDWLDPDGNLVTAPPSKAVSIVATQLDVASGAVIDLSGGGDFVAEEWIGGLGGSRNVLKVSTTIDTSAQVYAIVPGFSGSVAPVDYSISNPSQSGDTAFFDIGRTVTIEVDLPGLPAGTYVLLPGQYAILPGAYRVQVVPGSTDGVREGWVARPDGTYVVNGRLGYGDFSTDSRIQAFTIQSSEVWRQYSEIAQSTGNAFFTALAADEGVVTPRLAADAGRLSIVLPSISGVTASFSLDGGFVFNRDVDRRGGQVDFVAPKLAIVAPGQSADESFVAITTDNINSFNAESIFFGATRSSGFGVDTLDQMTTDIVVQTTADDPLKAPEIVLDATNAIEIAEGSVIKAEGETSGGGSTAIRIGEADRGLDPITDTPLPDISGNSALLRVSNNGIAAVVREAVDGSFGAMTLGDNVVIDGGRALQIDGTSAVTLSDTVTLGGESADIAGQRINFLGTDGTVIGGRTLALLTNSRSLSFHGSESIDFAAPLSIAAQVGAPRLERLTLDTPDLRALFASPGTVAFDADIVELTNSFDGVATSGAAGNALFQVTADTLILAGSDRTIDGLLRFEGTAAKAVVTGEGSTSGVMMIPGSVLLTTPIVVAAAGSDQTILSTVDERIDLRIPASGAATDGTDVYGGKLVLDGSAVTIDTAVSTRAGVLSVRARSGDVEIAQHGRLFGSGFRQEFVDTAVILPGADVTLTADVGRVSIDPQAIIDVTADVGGNGGALTIFSAQAPSIAGVLKGAAGGVDQTGASLDVETREGLDFAGLAAQVISGGFSNAVRVATGQGDLVLNQGLTARAVAFVADGGSIEINRTIDVSGPAGGTIDLFGANGVTLNAGASLLAGARDEDERGGQITIGTNGTGVLTLRDGSLIDVAGGSDYGSAGGTIHFRVPFLDANETTVATHEFNATLQNYTAVIFEPYQTVDIGTSLGGVIASAADWARLFTAFTPSGERPVGADYGKLPSETLVMPGLELTNGDPTVNHGDITITESINLLPYRYGAADAPGILTIRAAGDLRIAASISDGFENVMPAGNLVTWDGIGPVPLSWSYNLVAGARVGSADPLAVAQRVIFESGALVGRGNFLFGSIPTMTVSGGYTNSDTRSGTPLGANCLIRTGTGNITVIAGGVGLGDRTAETEYTLSDAAQEAGFHVDSDAAILFLSPTAVLYTAGVNLTVQDGFVDDGSLLSESFQTVYDKLFSNFFYLTPLGINPRLAGLVANAPAFATRGGDVRLEAPNGSIVAQQHFHDTLQLSGSTGIPVISDAYRTGRNRKNAIDLYETYLGQMYTPWLLGQGYGSTYRSTDGVFGGDGEQSARWVLTGAFEQGVATIGGGDLTIRSGGDVRDVSLSVVSTYRATGGKSLTDTPELHSYGGGNLTVEAAGDIASIVTLVDEGHATIHAGGALTSDYEQVTAGSVNAKTGQADITATKAIGSMFFVGNADYDVTARGPIDIEGVAEAATLFENSSSLAYSLDQLPGYKPPTSSIDLASRVSGVHQGPGYVFGADASISLVSASGDLYFSPTDLAFLQGYGSQSVEVDVFSPGGADGNISYLPAQVRLAATQGSIILESGIILASASVGNLEILAYNSVDYFGYANVSNSGIKLIDADPANMVSALNPRARLSDTVGIVVDALTPIDGRTLLFADGYNLDNESTRSSKNFTNYYAHDSAVLHLSDPEPIRMVALTGSIRSGYNPDDPVDVSSEAYIYSPETLYFDKAAIVYAGGDILNMTFVGNNASVGDVTSIHALGDIRFDYIFSSLDNTTGRPILEPGGGSFIIGGPGQFILEAGGSLFLRPSESSPSEGQSSTPYGVLAVGNRINPYLPRESADVAVLFGTEPGLDVAGFVSTYIDPANADAVPHSYIDELVTYMNQRLTALAREADPQTTYEADLTPDEAFAQYSALSDLQKRDFIEAVLFQEFQRVFDRVTYPNESGGSARAYAAIDKLFPASFGYTDNLATTPTQVATGNLDMLNAVVRTEFGSSLTILGPGGSAAIGGLSTPANLQPNVQGVFTLRGGDIRVFVDGDYNVFQSRTLTLQGGDVSIISGNGNIDAGRGKQTARYVPPLIARYSAVTTNAFVDFAGLVSGSGIGAIVTIPGSPIGNVVLATPRGFIDAGEGGIRASGNLSLVANQVKGAENVQVGGQSVGLATGVSVSTATLVSSAGAAEQASSTAEDLATSAAQSDVTARRIPTIFSVEVVGFGDDTSKDQ